MSVKQLKNYAEGKWIAAKDGDQLFNAITGDAIYTASSQGLDFGAMMNYARKVGGPALRKLTFHQRGRMLKALAMYLMERKDYFYQISSYTGATKVDSWIDIEGGIGNLFANASLRRQFPDERFYVDGEAAKLSKNGTFIGHHIMVPREKKHRYTGISYFSKFALQPYKPFWYGMTVLEPEIENITQQKYSCRIVLYLVQPAHNFHFACFAGSSIGHTQMEIRRKVYFFTGC